jgi:hypothetical protein
VALSLELMLPGREADHPSLSSVEVRNDWAIPPHLHASSWRGVQLINHMGNFTSFAFM